jgi:hypothetical protein
MALSKTTKVILWVTGSLVALTGGYFGFKYFMKPKIGAIDDGGVKPTDGTDDGGGVSGIGNLINHVVKNTTAIKNPRTTPQAYMLELKANKKIYIYSGVSGQACKTVNFSMVGDETIGSGDGEPFNSHSEYVPSTPSPSVTGINTDIDGAQQVVDKAGTGATCKVVSAYAIIGTILKKDYDKAKATEYIKVKYLDRNTYKYGYVLKSSTLVSKTTKI